MELRYYVEFLRRQTALIVGVALITGAVAAGSVATQQTKYQAKTSLLFSRGPGPALTDYDYDQFYLFQATEFYASNVVSWMNGADVRESIADQSGVADGRINARKSGGTIELTATAKTPEQAQAMANTAARFVADRTKTLSAGNNRAGLETTISPLGEQTVKPPVWRGAVSGLLAGLIFGLVLAIARESLRAEPPPRRAG